MAAPDQAALDDAKKQDEWNRKLRRLAPYFFSCFVDFIGYSLCIPILPFMVMGMVEENKSTAAGSLLTLFSVGQFFGGAVGGVLSDKFGRRPVVITLVWASAACYFLTGFCAEFWQLLLIRYVVSPFALNCLPSNTLTLLLLLSNSGSPQDLPQGACPPRRPQSQTSVRPVSARASW